jgi:hypothetical protein
MEKTKVNLIEDQKIDTTITDVTGYEAEQLLRKYGYQPQQFSTREEPQQQNNINPGLTFEEMVAQEELKRKQEEDRRRAQMLGPKPTTFDGRNGYDSEVKYGSDDDTGFSFKIEITTDMKIPKY